MAFQFGASSSNSTPGGDSKKNNAVGFSFGGGSSAPAPSTVGFSFGGAAPASGGSKPETFSFGAASATGGASKAADVSFGGTPAPAAGDDKTAATRGFSFAGAAAPSQAPSAPSFGVAEKKPAAPAGGFSFGGADPTSSQAPTAPSIGAGDKKVPAPTGGFSFGGAAVSTDAKPPSAAPSFAASTAAPTDSSLPSFGKDISKTTAPSFGGAAAAPAQSKSAGAFSFGVDAGSKAPKTPTATEVATTTATPATPVPVQTPEASKTPANTTAPHTSAAPSAPEPKPLPYQTLTVEQIINLFQKELEQDALAYREEASRIAEYDAILRDSQRDISRLTQQAQLAMMEQDRTESSLTQISTFQNALEETLQTVESDVDAVFRTLSSAPPIDADVQRERLHATVAEVEGRLAALELEATAALDQVTAHQKAGLQGTSAQQIVAILNDHHNALSEIDVMGRNLQLDIGQVKQKLKTVG